MKSAGSEPQADSQKKASRKSKHNEDKSVANVADMAARSDAEPALLAEIGAEPALPQRREQHTDMRLFETSQTCNLKQDASSIGWPSLWQHIHQDRLYAFELAFDVHDQFAETART